MVDRDGKSLRDLDPNKLPPPAANKPCNCFGAPINSDYERSDDGKVIEKKGWICARCGHRWPLFRSQPDHG